MQKESWSKENINAIQQQFLIMDMAEEKSSYLTSMNYLDEQLNKFKNESNSNQINSKKGFFQLKN